MARCPSPNPLPASTATGGGCRASWAATSRTSPGCRGSRPRPTAPGSWSRPAAQGHRPHRRAARAPGLEWDGSRSGRARAAGPRGPAACSEETRGFVAAYVAGVNEVLPGATCPELDHLGATAEPWQPWTPLAVFAAQHLLFGTLPLKLWRRHPARRLGRSVRGRFDARCWGAGQQLLGGRRGPHRERPADARPATRTGRSRSPTGTCRCGSPARRRAIDVAGFTFPGVPGVQHFAHAGEVAWGITNAMGDYQDVYVEQLERDGDGVLGAGGRTAGPRRRSAPSGSRCAARSPSR